MDAGKFREVIWREFLHRGYGEFVHYDQVMKVTQGVLLSILDTSLNDELDRALRRRHDAERAIVTISSIATTNR